MMVKQTSAWLPPGITKPLPRWEILPEWNAIPRSSTTDTVCRETVEAKEVIIKDEELQNSWGTELDTKTCPGQRNSALI